mgnify:CR=1 FL=1|tara:strand:+ start:525 stop:791 length:267 start_codon:yes stop_codon:yes gene_type:complete
MVNSKRKQQALNGGFSGSDGSLTSNKYLVGTKHIKLTKGSSLNWGGNSKMGSAPTVGVSLFALNLFSNCPGCKKGVNPKVHNNGAASA